MERGLVKISTGYMHYRAAGQGKPLIIMHAAGQSSAVFIELMEVLAKSIRVFAIDHPSYGMSDHIPGTPMIEDYARYMAEFMDAVGVKKASFMGESTSGYIGVQLANTQPQRVEKVLMISTPFYPSEEFKRKRHSALTGNQHPADPTGFPLPRTMEFVTANDAEHIPMHPTQLWLDRGNVAAAEAGRDRWQLITALGKYAIVENLGRLKQPAMVIWGDHFFAVQFREEFIRLAKNLQVTVIKDARFASYVDHTEEVGQTILKFLG